MPNSVLRCMDDVMFSWMFSRRLSNINKRNEGRYELRLNWLDLPFNHIWVHGQQLVFGGEGSTFANNPQRFYRDWFQEQPSTFMSTFCRQFEDISQENRLAWVNKLLEPPQCQRRVSIDSTFNVPHASEQSLNSDDGRESSQVVTHELHRNEMATGRNILSSKIERGNHNSC